MSWGAKCKRLNELIKEVLIKEPCLDLPVNEQQISIDTQYDTLDSVIYDALLEEDFLPLPVIDPKIVQWIDRLQELEEKQLESTSDAHGQQESDRLQELEKKQLESTSDAHGQQEPVFQTSQTGNHHAERDQETTVQAIKVNKGQLSQLQPQKCDMCNKEFRFLVNIRRHRWRHCYRTEEKALESSRDQFSEYWEKLEDEKALKVISVRDVVLPAILTELQVNDIIDAVFSYVKQLDAESQWLKYNPLVAFFLKPDGAKKRPPFQGMLEALRFLSDDNFFRGTLTLEMQQIVFPHGISMAKIEEQGLLASFGFLVEYCMMKAWADDREQLADLLLQEEEAKKQMLLTASTSKAKKSKPSSSKRRKEKARKQEFELSKKLTDDNEEHDISEDKEEDNSSSRLNQKHMEDKQHDNSKDKEDDSSSRLNQNNSQEDEKNMVGNSSEFHTEQDSSFAASTPSNLVSSVDESVQDIPFSSPNQEIQAIETMADNMLSLPNQDSSFAASTSSNLVSSVDESVQDIPFSSPNQEIQAIEAMADNVLSLPNQEKAFAIMQGMKQGDLMDDDINDGGSLSQPSTSKLSQPPSYQGKKRKQKESKQRKKHREGKSSKDEKGNDSLLQLNQSNSKQREKDPTDQSSESDKEDASSNAAATQSNLLPCVCDAVQDNMPLSLNREKATETMKEIESGDLRDSGINDLEPLNSGAALDDGDAVQDNTPSSPNQKATGTMKEIESGDLRDHSISDLEPLISGSALEDGDVVQDNMPLSVNQEKSTETMKMESGDLSDHGINELEPLNSGAALDDADAVQDNVPSSLNHEKATEITKEMQSSDFKNDLEPLNSRAPLDDGGSLSKIPHLEKSEVGQGERETTDAGSASKGEAHESSSPMNQEDSRQSEENVTDECSQHLKGQDESSAAPTQLNHMPNVHSFVQDNVFSSQNQEDSAKFLEGIVWGDLTNDEIRHFTRKSPAESISPAPQRSLPSKMEGPKESMTQLQQVPRKSEDSKVPSKSEPEGCKGLKARGGTERTKISGKTDSPATQRDSLSSKGKGPAESKDSTTQLESVLRESEDSKTPAKTIPQESEDSKTSGRAKGTKMAAMEVPDNSTRRLMLRGAFNFDISFSDHMQYHRRRWDAASASQIGVELEDYDRALNH